jgi:hypothetical protein
MASDFPGLSGCCAAQAISASVIYFGIRNATNGCWPVAGLPRFFLSVLVDIQTFYV